jgi:hypothetical protein
MCFTFQPLSINSTASQSSNSWFAGGSLVVPKSSVDFTEPTPKISCQNRLTVTRAVSGLSAELIHLARPRRFVGAPAGIACSTPGVAAVTLSFGFVV